MDTLTCGPWANGACPNLPVARVAMGCRHEHITVYHFCADDVAYILRHSRSWFCNQCSEAPAPHAHECRTQLDVTTLDKPLDLP